MFNINNYLTKYIQYKGKFDLCSKIEHNEIN